MKDWILLICIMVSGSVGLYLSVTAWSCYFCSDAELSSPVQAWIGFTMMLPVTFWFMTIIGEITAKKKENSSK